jgi:hypothetical protein
MVRKAIYKHATQVDTATYPDDGSSPVGSNEWNEAPDQAGMIGNTPTTSTITIATGVATITDSVTVVAAETGTTDTLDKLSITNTNEFDLVYLFADTGDTITLTHTSSPSADGHIATVSSVDETLSSTTPTILIRKGNYWYGYGGGVVNAVSDIGDVTITSNSAGEILKWNGSAWVNNTLAEADIGSATAVALNTSKTGITSGQASAITANTAKVTYPSADSTKLAGIEASATADQTGAEIKSAYEAETNAFTDSQFTKLSNIETSATADQTDAEIRTAVEAATDSNVFTDADHSKLNAIEASATADQSNAEIVAAVEAGTDSNTFTDADHSKLNAIEAAADVTDATNVNAAGAAMLSDTTTAGMGFVIDEDTLSSNLDTKVPTQQSVKAYVDSVSASDISLQGDYNASTNSPDLDTAPSGISKGDHYVVSVAGTFFSEALQAGDSLIAKQDSPTTFAHWILTNNNLTTPITNNEVSVTANIALSKLATDPVARANHTGTQAASTISDFDTEVANNSAVTLNTAKTGITSGQASAITANTAKTGITSGQASEITANTAKTGITSGQASAITANTSKVTNATHTGDVTGSTSLTIATGAVDIPMLSATGTASSSTYLRGDNSWGAVTTYSAPTIGSTSIASGATVTTIAGLTLTTPNIGTPSAGILTSCTGLPLAGLTTSAKTEALIIACSDEITALAGTETAKFVLPYGFEVTKVKGSLNTTGASNVVATILRGASALATVTISGTTADDASPTNTTGSENDVISISIGGADATATGLKIYIIGYRT